MVAYDAGSFRLRPPFFTSPSKAAVLFVVVPVVFVVKVSQIVLLPIRVILCCIGVGIPVKFVVPVEFLFRVVCRVVVFRWTTNQLKEDGEKNSAAKSRQLHLPFSSSSSSGRSSSLSPSVP